MEIPMKILHIGNEKNVEHYTAKTPFTESAEVVNLPIGLTDAAYAQLAPDTEVIIVDAVTEISKELIKRLPSLRMIHSEGVAFNQIDLEAAGARGIYVCNCAGMNAKAVAEQTILLMLGVIKNVVSGDQAVRDGRQMAVKMGYMGGGSLKELSDCTVGLIGFGAIARAVADMLQGFGVTVYYTKRHRLSPEEEARYQVQYLSMDELLKTCDMLSLHVPVTGETAGSSSQSAGREVISLIRPGESWWMMKRCGKPWRMEPLPWPAWIRWIMSRCRRIIRCFPGRRRHWQSFCSAHISVVSLVAASTGVMR